MNNEHNIKEKVAEILRYEDAWDWDENEDIDTAIRFEEDLKKLGPIHVLGTLYLDYHDSMITSKMLSFAFVWKHFRIPDWIALLKHVEHNRMALYYFIPFCAQLLKIDLTRFIAIDSTASRTTQKAVEEFFKNGLEISPGGRWEEEQLEDAHIDARLFWETNQKEYEHFLRDV